MSDVTLLSPPLLGRRRTSSRKIQRRLINGGLPGGVLFCPSCLNMALSGQSGQERVPRRLCSPLPSGLPFNAPFSAHTNAAWIIN